MGSIEARKRMHEEPMPPAPEPTAPRRFGGVAFAAAFAVTLVLFLVTIAPILPPMLLGAILAAFAAPLRARIERRFPARRVAAATVTILCLLAVLVPLTLIAILVVERLVELVQRAPQIVASAQSVVQHLTDSEPWLRRVLPGDLASQLTATVAWLGALIPSLVADVFDNALAFFLTLVSTYYLLRDGSWILARVQRALPLEPRHTRLIIDEFQLVGRAVILGTLGTAVAQGIVAGLGYLALGLPEPLLLGALTAVAALVPVVGASLVWFPAAIWLAVSGQMGRAAFLAAFGMLVVSTIDNVVRPILSKRGLQIHPLLVFLGIFGGLGAFGLSGLFLGPLFVSLFMAVARIYEREIAPSATILTDENHPQPTLSWRIAQVLGGTLRRRPPTSE